MENSVTKKLVQAKRPYHFKEQDAGCPVVDEVLTKLGENVQICMGTRAKPNVRINLKGNAKYVYHRQLSMSTCTYTKEPRYTLQVPQVQVYYTHLYEKKTIPTHMLYT
jgi:hypothetical protein